MSTALHTLSIAQASALIRTHKLSPVELTRALIDRADTIEPQINAFITRTSELALVQAKQAEAEISAGRWRGPLHGIPFALKDTYDTAGILTSGHSRVAMTRIPNRDAAVTWKMYRAGAVLLGKLSSHEFAHGGPSFDLPWPPARNPWNTTCFTGGSSSGSAAALAAGFAPATFGSDTGGSIRGPASFCGITGLMPTYGLISRAGTIPNSFTFDHCGPMARTMEDCAILLQATAGHDPQDAASIPGPVPNYHTALRQDLKGLRIGILRHYWEEDQPAGDDVRAAIEEAIFVLQSLGAVVQDARMPPLREAFGIKTVIAETEIFTVHLNALQQRAGDFGLDFLQRVLPACLFSSIDYVNATREHRKIMQQMSKVFEQFDILVTTGQGAAPRLDAHNPLNFWTKPNPFLPSNVAAGPAASVCNGFSSSGMPLGMQIIGKPFDDATVIRVGYAYQQVTDWHKKRPLLSPGTPLHSVELGAIAADDGGVDERTRSLCDAMARRAGLDLDDGMRVLLYRAAPYALEMSQRLKSAHDYDSMPANMFQLPSN